MIILNGSVDDLLDGIKLTKHPQHGDLALSKKETKENWERKGLVKNCAMGIKGGLESLDSSLDSSDVILVNVRWWDGYLEFFECDEVRQGAHLLWMRLTDGQNRYIPLTSGVRWFSVSPESHAKLREEFEEKSEDMVK